MSRAARILMTAGIAVFIAGSLHAQDTDLDAITAADEFRWGVTAMHSGRINEAIASFNRSLSFDPQRSLTRYWLGRAYYYAGFVRPALDEWRWVAEQDGATAVLNTWIERVEIDQGLTRERLGPAVSPGRYVSMVDLPGTMNEVEIFRRPTMVRPRRDGYFYVASFGTHSVVLLDPNGVREMAIDGGIEGFDRPFDVLIRPDGSLLVSEFGADRIAFVSPAGFKTGSFGTTGVGEGEFLGPQFLAADGDGALYVTDYGNRRVSKFTLDGDFLFSFGEPTRGFEGLRSPAGIVVMGDEVFVADTDEARIAVFDRNGNHLRNIEAPIMSTPEGLSRFDAESLLVSDGNRLYRIETETEAVTVLSELADGRRLLGAAMDANSNLIATDFASNTVLVMAASEELYTGLNVEVDYVNSSAHPRVLAAVTVTDRNGRPLLGLDESNFRVTEDRYATGEAEIVRAGYLEQDAAVSLVVQPGIDANGVQTGALEVYDALDADDQLWVISSGEQPVVESAPPAGRLATAEAASDSTRLETPGALDLSIRLGASQLLTRLGRRAIVLLSDGEISPQAFERYSLVETGSHLANNHISFSVIYTSPRSSPELEYLVDLTQGSSVYVYEEQGARVVVESLKDAPSGSYMLAYRSVHESDFGRRYIPLEIEAYLLERSGRDVSGYYGPLEF
jgi:DNA-binding beta-propeller fold protein YncE